MYFSTQIAPAVLWMQDPVEVLTYIADDLNYAQVRLHARFCCYTLAWHRYIIAVAA